MYLVHNKKKHCALKYDLHSSFNLFALNIFAAIFHNVLFGKHFKRCKMLEVANVVSHLQ